MEKIENYNYCNLCSESTCSKPETEIINVKINGMKIILCFCKKHSEEWEKNNGIRKVI